MNKKNLMPSLAAPVARSLHGAVKARAATPAIGPSACWDECRNAGYSSKDCVLSCDVMRMSFGGTPPEAPFQWQPPSGGGRYHVK